MTNENILIICKNALSPYEGGKEAFQRIKRGLELELIDKDSRMYDYGVCDALDIIDKHLEGISK